MYRNGTSSFLVTNAQFPDEIRRVPPVTQFYISVDGSTKEYIINISKNEEINNNDKNENDQNKEDNNVVKVNENRKLQIIIGVASLLVIIIVVILFSVISIKRSLKKRAELWK